MEVEVRLFNAVIIMTGLWATRAVMGYPLRLPARPVEGTEKVIKISFSIQHIVSSLLFLTIYGM
jgi:hypothetical protein